MKKMLLIGGIAFTTLFAACGEESSEEKEEKKSKSPVDLAQEVCDCMKDAGTDMDELNKCRDLGPEHAKKIGSDKEAAEAYTKKVMECSKEIASDLQK